MKEFELKIWRLHPQGVRLEPADKTLAGTAHPEGVKWCGPFTNANKYGFWVYPPMDIDFMWKGGNEFEHKVLNPWEGEEIDLVRGLSKDEDVEDHQKFLRNFGGRLKVDFGRVEPNICQMWTGCLKKGTRLLTEHGIQKIEDIQLEDCNVLTEYGKRNCGGVVHQGVKKTVSVSTWSGNKISVSVDHRFKIVEKGRIEWRRADDLAPGDKLLSVLGDGGLLPQTDGSDPLFWYVCGHLFGDGCISKRGVCTWIFAEQDKEAKITICNWLTESGYKYWETQIGNINYINVYKPEKILDFMPTYCPGGKWRKNGLLDQIWITGKVQICGFLRALFTTDGICRSDKAGISFCTIHENVARDVKLLLSFLGIVSKIVHRLRMPTKFGGSGQCYEVHVIGAQSVNKFRDVIGFGINTKIEKLNKSKKFDCIMGFHGGTQLFKKMFPGKLPCPDRKNKRFRVITEAIRRIRKGISDFIPQSILVEVINYANRYGQHEESISVLREWVECNWWVDEVVSVCDEGQCEVYDVVNSETESYVSESLVCHNCIFQTPPGWALLVRSPINLNMDAPYRIQEGILETDWLTYDIWINIAVQQKNVPIQLRRDQWPPLAQIVPVPKDAYDKEWTVTEEVINRSSEEADKMYTSWGDYNFKKYVRMMHEKEKDSGTYYKERARHLGKRISEPEVKKVERKPLKLTNSPKATPKRLFPVRKGEK